MKAMILAAGLGQRMRPLTDHLPKPLLRAGGKPLLQYHLESLAQVGIHDVVINLAYLGEKIRDYVGDGNKFNVQVSYSTEPQPLETAGGILNALPLLGNEPFILINGDVWSEFPLEHVRNHQLGPTEQAHLVLVPNPAFHPNGDFSPDARGLLVNDPLLPKYTFAGISLINPDLIFNYPKKRQAFPLAEVLRYGIENKQITAQIYHGRWSDVGTPERLFELDAALQQS